MQAMPGHHNNIQVFHGKIWLDANIIVLYFFFGCDTWFEIIISYLADFTHK